MSRPAIIPRVMTNREAAHYCGFRGERGAWPRWAEKWGAAPIGDDRRDTVYDVRDLDRAIDRSKGIAPARDPEEIEW